MMSFSKILFLINRHSKLLYFGIDLINSDHHYLLHVVAFLPGIKSESKLMELLPFSSKSSYILNGNYIRYLSQEMKKMLRGTCIFV